MLKMKAFWRSLAVSVALGAGGSANAASVWPANSHEYQVVLSDGLTWWDARSAAPALGTGWELASIGSAEENAFVTSLLDATLVDRAHFWLNATDVTNEGVWVWLDGTTFSYTNWWAGEPSGGNISPSEDFLAYDLRGGSWAWNDVASYDNYLRGYIAERSVAAVPEPSSILLLVAGIAALSALTRARN